MKKSNIYRHPEQSGIDAGAKCAEKPFLDLDWSWLEESAAILPAGQKAPELTEEQKKEIDEINAAKKQLDAAKQRTLLEHIERMGQVEQQEVPELITDKDVEPGLANLDATPGPNNAAQVGKFSVCMHQLFKITASYQRKRADVLEKVFEWQLWLLRNQWQDLRKVQHVSVTKVDVHEYIWSILKRVQNLKVLVERESLMLHMLRDFKRLSMNPRSVDFRPKAKAKPKVVAKAKASA